MLKEVIYKSLVFVIIGLFIGANVIPSISGNSVVEKNHQTECTAYSCYRSNSSYPSNLPGGGNTYYVSTSGYDGNLGTQSSPWRHIQYAADHVSAGDTVLVRGGTYNEKIIFECYGDANAWITFKNYPNELPIIEGTGIDMHWGSGLVTLGTPAWSDWPLPPRGFYGIEYFIFDGFKVQNSTRQGILAQFSNHIYIQNCQVYNTWGPAIESNNGYEYPPYGNWDPTPHPNHIYVYNNYVGTGVNYGWAGEAISMVRTDYAEVMYNSVIDTTKEGIDYKCGCSYGLIAYNEVVTPGVGIYIDSQGNWQHDFHIHSNYLHGDGGIYGGNELGGTIENLFIYNNLVCAGINGFGCIGIEGGRINICVVCNTFDVGNIAFQLAVKESAMYTGLVIRNNIIKGGFGVNLNGGVMTEDDFVLDYNLFDCSSGAYGTNYITGDPKWVNPSAGDYHLLSTSPAIDAGSNMGASSVDFDGNLRPRGTGVDIGAFEYAYGNNPPNIPSTPSGPSSGNTGVLYTYSTSTTDPDGDQVYYLWDWGDGTYSGWTGPYDSCATASAKQKWSKKDTYQIKVKAKDTSGAESVWSDSLSVTMPKNKMYHHINILFERFLQRFPLFEKILNQYYYYKNLI